MSTPLAPENSAVTPTDEKLEKLLDGWQRIAFSPPEEPRDFYNTTEYDKAVHEWDAKLAAARAALREYVSEDTRRLDWLIESGAIVDESNRSAEDGEPWQCTITAGGFGIRSDFFWGATPREVIDKASASMKEHPE